MYKPTSKILSQKLRVRPTMYTSMTHHSFCLWSTATTQLLKRPALYEYYTPSFVLPLPSVRHSCTSIMLSSTARSHRCPAGKLKEFNWLLGLYLKMSTDIKEWHSPRELFTLRGKHKIVLTGRTSWRQQRSTRGMLLMMMMLGGGSVMEGFCHKGASASFSKQRGVIWMLCNDVTGWFGQ